MKKCLVFFILFVNFNAHSSPSQEIINHFKDINSLEFKFSQKIDNNNIEKGECIISYPKKIFCKYYDIYNKIDDVEYICNPRGRPDDFNRLEYDLKTLIIH